MKKTVLFMSLAALFIVAGCNKEKPMEYLYMVQAEISGERTLSRDGYDYRDNALYKLAKNGINEINKKYGQIVLASDSDKVLESYDCALDELKALKSSFNAALETGADFGASEFSFSCKCVVTKEIEVLKASENFVFKYQSNTRIVSAEKIVIALAGAESVSGSVPIRVSDRKEDLTILGFKLYDKDSNPSNFDLIKKVEVQTDPENTVFVVNYKATKEFDKGNYYILIQFQDIASDVFDLMVNVEIK